MTDVTEFKYYIGPEIRKVYLSAILDLYDRRIVAYKISNCNDNRLVLCYKKRRVEECSVKAETNMIRF